MGEYSGSEIIVEYLIKENVPYVFGLCGHGDAGFLDALVDRKDKLKMVDVRHEEAAGFMADAYFRVAHKPVATITSCGPGSAHMVIALATAMMDAVPFLAITGNVPTSQFSRCPFQETGRFYGGDFPSVIRPYVKRSYQPTRADMVPLAIRQGFKTMLTGRTGPVNLDVPFNVFVEKAEVEIPEPGSIDSRAQGNPDSVAMALDLLTQADKPLILAGHGVILSEASEELTNFAKHLSIPVATTPNGVGSIDMREKLSVGPVGRNGTYAANEATRNCDVLLAVGAEFCDRVSGAWIPGYTFNIPPTKLIQVHIDPDALGRNYSPTIGILGNPKSVLTQLMELIKSRNIQPQQKESNWVKRIQEWKAEWEKANTPNRTSDAVPIRPERAVRDMREVLPEDAVVFTDVGGHHLWMTQHWLVYRPRTAFQSWGFASMGFGVCGILGAKLAAPDKPCVAVVGDAGFLMNAHIVSTAVQYRIPAIWVIWNNNSHNAIRQLQMGAFGRGREIAVDFVREDTKEFCNPDFVALAKAMGAQGTRVEKPADIKPALEQALQSEEPFVLELMDDREAAPLPTGGWSLPPLPPFAPRFSVNG